MGSNLKIGVTPLTNTIVIGQVLKNGTWGANRTDVTSDAVQAVIHYAMKLKDKTGDNIIIENEDGSVFCEMVINIPATKSN